MKKKLDAGEVTFEDCMDAHNGWKAHAERGKKKPGKPKKKNRAAPNTYYLVGKMDALFNELFKDYIKEGKADVKDIGEPSGGCAGEGHRNKV